MTPGADDLHATGDAEEAERWLAEGFDLSARLQSLPGARGRSFKAIAADGSRSVFRIYPAAADPRPALEVAVLHYVERHAPDLPLPRLFLGRGGSPLPAVRDAAGRARPLRLTTWLDGVPCTEAPERGPRAAAALGRLLARLDRCLAGFHHPAAAQPHAWDLAHAAARRDDAARIAEADCRAVVQEILHRFVLEVSPRLGALPRQVIHGNADGGNVLLDAEDGIAGLVGFGSLVETWRVNELAIAAATVAIAAATVAIGAADPLAAILPLVEAYGAENPISATEADALFDLILTRLAVSLALAARQSRPQPDDAWAALSALAALNRPLMVARLRRAAGHDPVPARRAIEHWILQQGDGFGPLLPGLDDLAVLPLGADLDPTRGRPFREALQPALAAIKGTAVGRYGEDRSIYDADTGPARRTIHHAIDVYAPAGTPVLAPLAGRVAMLGNDTSIDGFGGIVVLEHEAGTPHRFWTFYGHLAPAGLADLAVGAAVGTGDVLGTLGAPAENGNWPPHVHMQLMTLLCFDRAEAIIGLSLRREWDLWESIFPNPNGILGLGVETAAIVPAILPGEAPLKMLKGEGAYLVGADGRRHLDMVNGAAHVGHGHPRVAAAIARQAALLSTGTGHPQDSLIEYTRRLQRLLPQELSTIFLLNSGDEANDLALRLAKAHTGGTEVIVLDHADHGRLSSLAEISPRQFDAKGGGGRPRHVWVTEMPDLYRGRFRTGEAEAGARYAEKAATLLRDMNGLHRRPAALFVEAILGAGGQLVLPDGYLTAVFTELRAAGGLCIVDERRTGLGRVGSHLWAFEIQDVVPDIVTLGESIGNGHPMGAVACRPEIAAFARGMEGADGFGGNPVSAAAGLAVLDILRDERLMPRARAIGACLKEGLARLAGRHDLIGDIRGRGLSIGVELVRDRETLQPATEATQSVVAALQEAGILVGVEGPHRNVLSLTPPLSIPASDCDFFLQTLDEVMARLGQ
jgi:4-aminobutyrate aminotransferase-like enzyme/Ser/Thr protein kinase RdoA (MazF antagonist)